MHPLPRDFVGTAEGLLFAVVAHGLEEGRVLGFLRYMRDGLAWRKLDTEAANALLANRYPHYLYTSASRQADIHAIPVERVISHYQPRQRLAQIMENAGGDDAMETKLYRLLALLAATGVDLDYVGISGSLLIGAQRADSDFDLVIYDRDAFFQVRQVVINLLAAGRLQALSEALWRESYARRNCALDYADYLRHEQRKFNKADFEGTKFDITLTTEQAEPMPVCRKQGATTISARVLDASRAFDYPACYTLDHPQISKAYSYTHTYAGQAWPGESVKIAGQLEQTADGSLHIVVGSSREAPGEYIVVESTF